MKIILSSVALCVLIIGINGIPTGNLKKTEIKSIGKEIIDFLIKWLDQLKMIINQLKQKKKNC